MRKINVPLAMAFLLCIVVFVGVYFMDMDLSKRQAKFKQQLVELEKQNMQAGIFYRELPGIQLSEYKPGILQWQKHEYIVTRYFALHSESCSNPKHNNHE